MSWPYFPDLLATPVPRYTSYPTAAEFRDDVGAAQMTAALAGLSDHIPASLYVHFPFCREICWYCGCNTGAANRTLRLEAYLEALNREFELVSARMGGRPRIGRIAFGGGSPNAMPAEAFVVLVERLRRLFDARDALVSVEIDPRIFDYRWAAALAASGVEQASLGVQTFDPGIQKAIGRVQPREAIAVAVDLLRASGVRSLNFDLMYGLPGQGLAELEATLDAARALAPDRIALFGYAHVPDLIPRQRVIDSSLLPSTEARFRQAELGHAFLTGHGFEAVGFDHFAAPDDPLAAASREGRLHRNFQGFTDDDAAILIGFGASAVSRFPDCFAQNVKNSGRYRMLTLADRLTGERGILRSPQDRLRGRIIESILCYGRAEIDRIDRADARAGLLPFEQRGLITWLGSTLLLSADALPYARAIASAFDVHRARPGRTFSNAV